MSMEGRPAIRIGTPYIEETPDGVRLSAPVERHGAAETVWFSVGARYGQYLTGDRADAFVVGFLPEALRTGADIVCDAPVTRRLLYQLNHYLLPILTANIEGFEPMTVRAAAAEALTECAGAVGTGWTGGVDSMYTLMQSLNAREPNHRLTHLLIANNGALESGHDEELLRSLVEKAETGAAAETGLAVVGISTNLQQLLCAPYLAVAAYRLPAVVLALQKLFGVFLNSASYEFSRFSFVAENSAYYELLPLCCFETDCTVFYSAGGAVSRAQKLRELSDFPLAQRYLHPCIYTSDRNCGKCGKCIRTETALYGLGTLEHFSAVFDVEAFEQNKDWYIAGVLAKKNSQHYGEALMLLRQRGIEPSPKAQRMARIMRAAQSVVQQNKQMLLDKLMGE